MMVETSVGQRFLQLIQQLGMSKNAFAMSLDKTATVIQHLVDERNKPGFDLMCKVFEVYPNVSKDWLLLGHGPMLLPDALPPVAPPAAEQLTAAAAPAAVARPLAAPAGAATPHFPEPLFAVSAGRLSLPEVPAAPSAPAAAPVSAPVAARASAIAEPASPQPAALGAAPLEAQPAPASPVPSTAPAASAVPAASPDASALTAVLHAQYLQHQLALAEQRNQHLLEQQKLMQQMLDLLRRPV